MITKPTESRFWGKGARIIGYILKAPTLKVATFALTLILFYVMLAAIAFSPNQPLLSLVAITLSIFNFLLTLGLIITWGAKQFSTHELKIMDLKTMVKAHDVPLPSYKDPFATPEEEEELEKKAKRVTDALFSPTKENLTDNLF